MLPAPRVSARLSLLPSPFFPSANSTSNSLVCSILASPDVSARVCNCTLPFKFNSLGSFTLGQSFIAACSARKSSISFPARREPRTSPSPSIFVSHPSGANCAVSVFASKFEEPWAPWDFSSGLSPFGPGAATSFSARKAASSMSVSSPASKRAVRVSASTGPWRCIVRESRSKSRLFPVTRTGSCEPALMVFLPAVPFPDRASKDKRTSFSSRSALDVNLHCAAANDAAAHTFVLAALGMHRVVPLSPLSEDGDLYVLQQAGIFTLKIRYLRCFHGEDLLCSFPFGKCESTRQTRHILGSRRGRLLFLSISDPFVLEIHSGRQSCQQQRGRRGPACILRRFASLHVFS